MNDVFLRIHDVEDTDLGFPASEIAYIEWRGEYTLLRLRGGQEIHADVDAGDLMETIGAVMVPGDSGNE